MAANKRKVSFYRLSLEKQISESEQNKMKVIELKDDEIEKHFQKLYENKMVNLENGNKAIDIDTAYSRYVVEIVEYKEHEVFAKIGQQNHANTVALRDKNTLESASVPMTSTQLLELYTFCLIDFKNGIVSYIGINGAPRISAIKELFNKFLNEENIYAKLAAITTDDILKILVKKGIISKISLTVAVPSDEILSKMGLPVNDFDSLRNVKTSTASYNLVASRNKTLFQNSGHLAELFDNFKNKFGRNLKSIVVHAKDSNETSQLYDLLHYCFTKTVTLSGDNQSSFAEDSFKIALKDTYESNKDELLRYI